MPGDRRTLTTDRAGPDGRPSPYAPGGAGPTTLERGIEADGGSGSAGAEDGPRDEGANPDRTPGSPSYLSGRVPLVVLGLGVALAGLVLAEAVAFVVLSLQPDALWVANLLTSLPFVAVLLVGGYSLVRGDYPADRYRRIGIWMLAGVVFLGGFFGLVALATPGTLLVKVGIVRWGVAAGAGSGALVGIFEARAIERAVAAERTVVRNEELLRQNERLGDFANIIAHDLRNPLNVVAGRIEMARRTADDGNLEAAMSSLERMEQIIEETLTLARSGSVIDDPEAVDLATLAEESWEFVETGDATHEVAGPPTVVADRDRLRHLFENLYRNAVEHAGPDVTIGVGALPDGFYVEDDGPGIPAADRELVFDAGFTTSSDGTGFGLAIAKQIAEAHGWDMTVTESASGGARFEVTRVTVAGPAEFDTAARPIQLTA